jgi:membrane protein implicated in regulation of membrane protease activity
MVWWLWMLLGLALLVIELATPGGLFALFFGVSGIVVGGLTALGLAGSEPVQWLLFTVVSVLALGVLRGPLKARLNKGNAKRVVDFVGEAALVTEAVEPGGVGKVELRGSAWSARTRGESILPPGQRTRVERVEGFTVWVVPE